MSGNVHKLDRRLSGQNDLYAEMLERAHALVQSCGSVQRSPKKCVVSHPRRRRTSYQVVQILQAKRVGGAELDYVALSILQM